MASPSNAASRQSAEISAHYELGHEQARLAADVGRLEYARTCELITRSLPPAPAIVLDVGGGPGRYACWLAQLDYVVHLVDAEPLHVEQAHAASQRQPAFPLASANVGDARKLEATDESVDAALMLGPLYHLTERSDRMTAWREARRVLRPGGVVLAAAISRFASTLDGLRMRAFDDPVFAAIAEQDLRDGQHRNPTHDPRYFTTAYFHRPEELAAEAIEAGLEAVVTFGVEGPGWLLHDFEYWWSDAGRQQRLLAAARALETEPSIRGMSAHLLAVARRPG